MLQTIVQVRFFVPCVSSTMSYAHEINIQKILVFIFCFDYHLFQKGSSVQWIDILV